MSTLTRYISWPTIVLVGFAILLSMVTQWEIGPETWGYWTFSRILRETGQFIIPDRSPAYVVYLLLFSWLPYPTAVMAEYVVTSIITMGALVFFGVRYLGQRWAGVAAMLWIPYLQIAEPPPQKFALAISLVAICLRKTQMSRLKWTSFYALLGLTLLFRPNYIILLVLFLVWDGYQWFIHYRKGINIVPSPPITIRYDWPLLFLGIFWLLVLCRQSPHPWNTIYFDTATWFPHDGKRFEILQAYNWAYIETYSTFEGNDFYMTNKEVFDGATTTWKALRANPRFIASQMGRFLIEGIPTTAEMTVAATIVSSIVALNSQIIPMLILLSVMMGSILYGAWRADSTPPVRVFMVANTLMVLMGIVYRPTLRYYMPLIPVLLSSASWYCQKVVNSKRNNRTWYQKKTPRAWIFPLLMLIVLSNGLPLWIQHVSQSSYEKKRVISPQKSHNLLASLTSQCKGIMTLEHTFLAGFMPQVPIDHIYDVWEIPPFGKLENSPYRGLTPQRINCLFLSEEIQHGVGAATNYQIRYQQYIYPYAQQLLAAGAKTYYIPTYGTVIILGDR